MRMIVAAICSCFLLASCSLPQKPVDRFEAIRQMVCDGQYQQALPQLKAYSGKHDSRASLFIGKAHLGLGDVAAAKAAFASTVKKFPGTLEAHKSQYKLALLAYFEGDSAAAKQQFGKLATKPTGPLAAEAAAFEKFIQ